MEGRNEILFVHARLSKTQVFWGHCFEQAGYLQGADNKAQSGDVSYSTPCSVYDLSTGQHGYLIRQDCLEGFAQLAQIKRLDLSHFRKTFDTP